MKKARRIQSLVMAVLLAIGMIAGATVAFAQGASNDKVLVIGIDATFEERWNPFMAESAYDMQVLNQIFTPIQQLNEDNELVDYAGSCKAEPQEDGSVIYTITVNEGMTFSDGEPVTIDDYIYGLYVRSDPSYIGPMSLLPAPIEGMKEYYYDDVDYSAKIAELEKQAESYTTENVTFEQFMEYSKDTNVGDGFDASALPDYVAYIEGSGDEYKAMVAEIDPADADAVMELYARVEYDQYLGDYDVYNWFLDKAKQDYAQGNLSEGIDVTEISGIVKVDDYTCTVKYTEPSFVGDRDLCDSNGAGHVAPKHYYGEFTKGDVSAILSNMEPLGSGPYIWGGFSDNIVTCTANPNFFKGVPVTGTVRWQYIPQSDIIENLASGAIDIANPSCSQANIAELQSLGIEYHLVDNAGYGYMGVNTQRVAHAVRQGIFCLMNRAPAVEAYYGDVASVIERPMSTVVAEYPKDATTFYPYSREEALKYFETAGYTQTDGKLVDADGKQLVVNVYVGGDGEGNHPAYPMLVQAAEDMSALGAELQIQDVNFNVLQGAMNDGTADMWTMAWSQVNTCDKTTQFRSDGGQNRYRFADDEMDQLLDAINVSVDLEERKELVSKMLDLSMEYALELPLYQRKNMLAYNSQNLNMDTIPTASTFYSYEQVLYQVETLS